MSDSELQAVLSFYDAHMDPTGYETALLEYGGQFPDVRLMIQVESLEPRKMLYGVAANTDVDAADDYSEVLHLNPMIGMVRNITMHRVFNSEEYVSRTNVENSEFFDAFLKPRDRMNSASGFGIYGGGSSFALFSATIPAGLSEADRLALTQSLERIRPHVQRSFHLFREMSRRSTLRSAVTIIEHIPTSVAVFDSRKRLIHMNRRAEELLGRSETLSLSPNGALLGGTSRIDGRLRQASERVLASREPVGPIVLPRRFGRPLILYLLPARSEIDAHPIVGLFQEDFPAYLAYILDPDEVDPAPTDILTTALGVTPAEARLASMLHEGSTLREAAERSGTAYATARTQLASITEKLDLKRQSELTGLLARLAARRVV